MPRLNPETWANARADREAGMSQEAVAKKYGISRTAVQKAETREKWIISQNVKNVISHRAQEKVAGIVAGETLKKRAEAIDSEAEKTAEVIRRHREETNAIRERLYNGLKTHKSAADYADKRLAFEDLKAAKIASECLLNIHAAERRAWGLDEMNHDAGVIEIERSYG